MLFLGIQILMPEIHYSSLIGTHCEQEVIYKNKRGRSYLRNLRSARTAELMAKALGFLCLAVRFWTGASFAVFLSALRPEKMREKGVGDDSVLSKIFGPTKFQNLPARGFR